MYKPSAFHMASAAIAAVALGLIASAVIITETVHKPELAEVKQSSPQVQLRFDKGLSEKVHHKVYTMLYPDGLQVTDVKLGTGVQAAPGDKVRVHYTGKLMDGKVFDKGTIKFPLGQGKVIKGWDQGLLNMRKGGVRMLHIPPQLAYGDKAVGDKIPADSSLLFGVKLLGVQKAHPVNGKVAAWKKKMMGHKASFQKAFKHKAGEKWKWDAKAEKFIQVPIGKHKPMMKKQQPQEASPQPAHKLGFKF
mmetsp:Transcript_34146/g.53241  ORF Transcript_34146/g.53241 Transcript_34146/m.53241 type:complete len:248 (+) Transcript_34146:3-746(+)